MARWERAGKSWRSSSDLRFQNSNGSWVGKKYNYLGGKRKEKGPNEEVQSKPTWILKSNIDFNPKFLAKPGDNFLKPESKNASFKGAPSPIKAQEASREGLLSPSQAQVKESIFLPIKQSTQGGERAPDKQSVSSLVPQAVHGLAAKFFSPKEHRRGSSLPPRLETTNFTTEEGVDKVVSRASGLRKRVFLLG